MIFTIQTTNGQGELKFDDAPKVGMAPGYYTVEYRSKGERVAIFEVKKEDLKRLAKAS